MTKIFSRRAGAYIFDVIIISLVVMLLSYIPILNPHRRAYSEKYNELVMVNEKMQNNEISMEEYEQAYKPLAYEIYRLNTNYVIIDLVCLLLYFGVFQYVFRGQTLGKRLFQIQVVSVDEKPLTLLNFILRTVVLSNIIISILLQCIVHFMSVNDYYSIYNNVNMVGSVILYITLFMVLARQDGRGLHDFVGNTKVILTDELIQEKQEKIKKEQEVLVHEMEVREVQTEKKKKKKPQSKTKAKKN